MNKKMWWLGVRRERVLERERADKRTPCDLKREGEPTTL